MQETVVKTYKGSQSAAAEDFQHDANRMAEKGYVPTTQVWAAGSYGCGSFVVAALLCFILIGFLVFVYMLIVKPAGTLTVTYVRKSVEVTPVASVGEEKTCPRCAERVKAAALVCRYCGHSFEPSS